MKNIHYHIVVSVLFFSLSAKVFAFELGDRVYNSNHRTGGGTVVGFEKHGVRQVRWDATTKHEEYSTDEPIGLLPFVEINSLVQIKQYTKNINSDQPHWVVTEAEGRVLSIEGDLLSIETSDGQVSQFNRAYVKRATLQRSFSVGTYNRWHDLNIGPSWRDIQKRIFQAFNLASYRGVDLKNISEEQAEAIVAEVVEKKFEPARSKKESFINDGQTHALIIDRKNPAFESLLSAVSGQPGVSTSDDGLYTVVAPDSPLYEEAKSILLQITETQPNNLSSLAAFRNAKKAKLCSGLFL